MSPPPPKMLDKNPKATTKVTLTCHQKDEKAAHYKWALVVTKLFYIMVNDSHAIGPVRDRILSS